MPWTENCVYLKRGECLLAAQVAQLPPAYTPVNEDACEACKGSYEPTPQLPNQITAGLALHAVRTQQPHRLEALRCQLSVTMPELPPERPGEQVSYNENSFPCIHRGPELRRHTCNMCGSHRELGVFTCELKGRECTVLASDASDSSDGSKVELCIGCDLRAPVEAPVPRRTRHIGYLHRHGQQVGMAWANRYAGRSVVLAGYGPSLDGMDLAGLDQRGVVVAALNNAGAVVRPQLWFSADPPATFHSSIFEDASITCFVRSDYVKRRTRYQKEGTFQPGPPAQDFPNVVAYDVDPDCTLTPDRFFTAPVPVWCDHEGGRSVMLPALRILVDMGFTTINLIGCDFNMTPERSYAGGEHADLAACRSNERLYAWLNRTFAELQPHFLLRNVQIWNCTPDSKLDVFPRRSLEAALKDAALLAPGSLAGWYRNA